GCRRRDNERTFPLHPAATEDGRTLARHRTAGSSQLPPSAGFPPARSWVCPVLIPRFWAPPPVPRIPAVQKRTQRDSTLLSRGAIGARDRCFSKPPLGLPGPT